MSLFIKKISFILIVFFISSISFSQASLTIENNSKRKMTVKIMKGKGSGSLYKTITISSFSSETIFFDDEGYFFTKTKAVLAGKDPVYQKGQPFEVVNNSRGYSVLTLTFSITESTIPQASGGKNISKSEFDLN